VNNVVVKKESSRRLYEARIKLALDYIHKNLSNTIQLSDVAQACYFSEYHFHRLFHGFVGETVNDYIVRKRMERAAQQLVCNSAETITDIALSGGFSSAANFSKSFKKYFGLKPGQLREPSLSQISKNGKLLSKYGKAFDPQSLYSQNITKRVIFTTEELEKIFMNIRTQYMSSKKIAYLTAPEGYELNSIFETWDKMIQWAEQSNIKEHANKRYAICHDNPMITPVEKCRYDASIEVDESVQVNRPLSVAHIPEGDYAIAYYKGAGDKVSHFYMEIYSGWLPDSGFEPDDFPPVAHYFNDSRVDGFVEMEVLIKIKSI